MFSAIALVFALSFASPAQGIEPTNIERPKPPELWLYVPASVLQQAPRFSSFEDAMAAADKAAYATPGVQLLVLEIEGSFFVPAPPCDPFPCP